MKTRIVHCLNSFYNVAYDELIHTRKITTKETVEKAISIAVESTSRVFQTTDPDCFNEFVNHCNEWSQETRDCHHQKVIDNEKRKKFKLVTNKECHK